MISKLDYESLTNESSWWVGVSAVDDVFNKEDITPERIDAEDQKSLKDDDEGSSTVDLGEVLSTNNIMMIIGGLIGDFTVFVLRGGGKMVVSKKQRLRTSEATWGIQARDGWDDVKLRRTNNSSCSTPSTGNKTCCSK